LRSITDASDWFSQALCLAPCNLQLKVYLCKRRTRIAGRKTL